MCYVTIKNANIHACVVRFRNTSLEKHLSLESCTEHLTRLRDRLYQSLAVFILETRYPSGRASANILQIVRLSVSSIKTGTRRVTRLDELLFETRLERRISKSSSSRRVTRLLPVFILETDNRTNYKIFAEARPDG